MRAKKSDANLRMTRGLQFLRPSDPISGRGARITLVGSTVRVLSRLNCANVGPAGAFGATAGANVAATGAAKAMSRKVEFRRASRTQGLRARERGRGRAGGLLGVQAALATARCALRGVHRNRRVLCGTSN